MNIFDHQMEFRESRLKTFVDWPHKDFRFATPEKLSDSGFFLCGSREFQDRCICFCCGIALVNWESDDDPWEEHARHSPKCAFIQGAHQPTQVPISAWLKIAGAKDEKPAEPTSPLRRKQSINLTFEEATLDATRDAAMKAAFCQELVMSTILPLQ